MDYKALVVVLAAGTALSGCSVLKAAGYVSEFVSIEEEFETTPATAVLPTDKSATYNGAAGIGIDETANSGIALFGDMRAEVNFGASGGTMTGKISDFVGADVPDLNALENDPTSVAGLLTDAGGELALSGAFSSATFDAAISGNPLTLNDKSIAVGGTVSTQFRGTGAEAMYGSENTDGNLTLSVDGAPHSGNIEFWAKQ